MNQFSLSIRAFSLLAATLVAMLVAAGCGDDAKSASLNKAEFATRADALCRQARGQFQGEYTNLMREQKGGLNEDRLSSELVDIVVPIYSNLSDEIESLGTPAGEEQKVSAFLDALGERLDYASANPVEFVANLHPFADATKLAKASGLKGCSESFG